jgi:hypothetical protein
MLSKVCFWAVIISCIGVIIEGLVLEKNINTVITMAVTFAIMILAIIIFETMKHVEKRLQL